MLAAPRIQQQLPGSTRLPGCATMQLAYPAQRDVRLWASALACAFELTP